ncbi:arginine repressor [Enterococcus camelliae]|uniref:Arginine repressor n=1 Tax=Enterococcus camelliae TaxID=453959 RepID=A0ABW5TK07_9ENTE
MKKKERHRLIARLLLEMDIQKQEQFVEVLEERGIRVTQATISRDIKELNLVKVPSELGGYRYSLPAQNEEEQAMKLDKLLKNAFIHVKKMDKFVLLQTIPGNAVAVAPLIDQQYSHALFGILTDDDKVLMISNSEVACDELFTWLKQYEQ